MHQHHSKNPAILASPVVTSTRFSVTLTCFLIQVILSCNVGHGHSASGGGGYMNPSTYGAYQNNNQQQWPTQQHQQQQQQNQYYDTDPYQQQRQLEPPTSAEEPAVPPPLPPGWSEHVDPSSGQPYYYNSSDGSTTWDRPLPLSTANETTTDSDILHQQQYDTAQSFSPPLQEHSNNTDSKGDLLTHGTGSIDMHEHSNQENVAGSNSEPVKASSAGEDALTSISREENKIIEEEHWREAQGWNAPTDNMDGGRNSNARIENDNPTIQQSQGWNLPPPQSQANQGWGMVEPPQPENSERAPMNNNNMDDQKSLQSRPTDLHRNTDEVIPTPNQPQQQVYDESKFAQESSLLTNSGSRPAFTGNVPPHLQRPSEGSRGHPPQPTTQHRDTESNAPMEHVPPPVNIHEKNPPQIPQHQTNQQDSPPPYVQQPPPSALLRPPPTQGNSYQHSQQRPGVPGQQPYPQHGQGGNIYGQQPQYQDGGQYRAPPQYGGRPAYNQYPPPNYASPQQSYSSQAAGTGGGQLITQEQQNLVKESLGRTWQGILGLKDKTKEAVETATNTVAQSAREATQTIAEKGTGMFQ